MALAVLVLALLGTLTGCRAEMGLETHVGIDGSGTVALRVGADREMLDLLAEQGTEDPFTALRAAFGEEWRLTEGEETDGSRWFRAERDFSDPQDFVELARRLQQEDAGPAVLSRPSLTQESKLLTVRTTFGARVDLTAALQEAGAEGMVEAPDVDPALLARFVVIESRLTLPGSITDSNGDEIQGSTVVWRPGLAEPVEMRAESIAYRWGRIIVPPAAAVVLTTVAVSVWLLVRRRSRA